MKRNKKIFFCLLIALLFVFAVACAPAEEKEFFKVDVSYESGMGSVTLSQPENADGYAKDEKVTVTVTPNAGYEVDGFSVNGKEETLDLGKFTFQITSDTEIMVTFREAALSETEKYSVSLEYESEKGSVTLSPEVQDGKYEKGSEVTVTVKAKEGFEVDSVTVNGERVSPDENGRFTFTVTQDTKITAVFEAEISGNAKFDEAFRGVWRSADGQHEIVITETSFRYDDEEAERIERGSDGNGVYYNIVTKDGKEYTLNWFGEQKEVVLNVWIGSSMADNLFLKGDSPKIRLDENIQGVWGYDADYDEVVDEEPVLSLKITAYSVILEGKSSDLILENGYVGSGGSEKLDNYLFYINGEKHTLTWIKPEVEDGAQGYVLTLDGLPLTRNRDIVYFNDTLQGTFERTDGSERIVIVITEDSVTINGETVKVSGVYGAYKIEWNGKEYDLFLYSGNEFVLVLRNEWYRDGILAGWEDLCFLSTAQRPEIVIDERLHGTWTRADSGEELVINEGSITWGSDTAIILKEDVRGNGVYYQLFLRGVPYELGYSGEVITLDGGGHIFEFSKKLEGQGEPGLLGLPIGTYSFVFHTLTITKDSIKIYDADQDKTIILTGADLTQTAEGYTFIWKNYWGENHPDGSDQPMILILGTDEEGRTTLTVRDTTTQPDEEGYYNYSVIYSFTLG